MPAFYVLQVGTIVIIFSLLLVVVASLDNGRTIRGGCQVGRVSHVEDLIVGFLIFDFFYHGSFFTTKKISVSST